MLQLLAQSVDPALFDHTNSTRLANGVFEFGLTAEESEGFAERVQVCYLLLRRRARRAVRFAGVLDDDSFAIRRFAASCRLAVVVCE